MVPRRVAAIVVVSGVVEVQFRAKGAKERDKGKGTCGQVIIRRMSGNNWWMWREMVFSQCVGVGGCKYEEQGAATRERNCAW